MWSVKFVEGWYRVVTENGGRLLDNALDDVGLEDEQNALLIAAALNADEKGEVLTVAPVNRSQDRAARFDVPEIIYSNTRTTFLEPPSEEDVQAFLAREKANPSPQIAEYMNTACGEGVPKYSPRPYDAPMRDDLPFVGGVVFPDSDGPGATLRFKDGTSFPYAVPGVDYSISPEWPCEIITERLRKAGM